MTTASRNGRSPDRIKSTDDDARKVMDRVASRFRDEQPVFTRIDDDWNLWVLERWSPDSEDSISPEDAYTTNAPRVLAQKIIAFISATELIVRVPNDDAPKPQELLNDAAESLAIGMLKLADERLRRGGKPALKESLAFYSTVRGRYAATRAVLRKGPNGRTFPDILPLDPRHLVIEWGDDEPTWSAYRMSYTRNEIRNRYGNLSFTETHREDDQAVEWVYEYYGLAPNRDFDAESNNPFWARPNLYIAGTVIEGKWVKPLRDVFTLRFPVTAVPVDAQPHITPSERGESTIEHFGESVFSENRRVWETLNRATSYTIDLTAKASDPRKKMFSTDGTATLDEGESEKGAVIPLSTANQEDVTDYAEADISRAAGLMLQILQNDAVMGGLPPQAFGLLDKPLSSVALRQLGNNLEHRVMPRMSAVASCIEMSLQNLLDQYETGAYEPFPVSGRLLNGRRFASKQIEVEAIRGHDPVEVTMQLALPEDLSTIWAIAQQAAAPTVSGEPLASMEWIREKILKLPSHKVMRKQNLEMLARSQDELAATMEAYRMAVEEQDEELISILYDKLRIALLKRQVEGSMMIQQLAQMAAGGGMPAGQPQGQSQPGAGQQARPNLAGNPANGAPGPAQVRGMGNQPSPEAGWNTGYDRQRQDEDERLAQIGLERG